jgi:hypothetical protein
MQRINDIKNGFFEKVNKIDKPDKNEERKNPNQ